MMMTLHVKMMTEGSKEPTAYSNQGLKSSVKKGSSSEETMQAKPNLQQRSSISGTNHNIKIHFKWDCLFRCLGEVGELFECC